jgi:hypothetical protein
MQGELRKPVASAQLNMAPAVEHASLARRKSRHGDRRSLDTLARAVLLQRPDPISKQEQQTSSKPAESFSARALSSLSWLMHATRASRLQKRRVQRKDHASSRWKDYILTRRTVSRADDSARIKFVWTAIMLISPPRIDTDETRIAESQNFLTL